MGHTDRHTEGYGNSMTNLAQCGRFNENSAYRRHWVSYCVRIEASIPKKSNYIWKKKKEKNPQQIRSNISGVKCHVSGVTSHMSMLCGCKLMAYKSTKANLYMGNHLIKILVFFFMVLNCLFNSFFFSTDLQFFNFYKTLKKNYILCYFLLFHWSFVLMF